MPWKITYFWSISTLKEYLKLFFCRYFDVSNFKLMMRQTLNKGLGYFKSNMNYPYEALKLLQGFTCSRYLFVCESPIGYLSGELPIKRRLIILILQLSIWTFAFKCLIMSYFNNRTFSIYTGDFTYLYPRPDILNLLVFIILSGVGIAGKI